MQPYSSGHKQVINASGCRKEYEIAVEKGRIVIPIGSTGYMAKELFDEVKSQRIKYPYLQKYFDRLENETDVNKLVELILEIINEQQITYSFSISHSFSCKGVLRHKICSMNIKKIMTN